MRNTRYENLKEHSFDVAVITHALMVIGKKYFGKSYDEKSAITAALYHDSSEIFTGDMPTPIKYYNDDIKSIYKGIERTAEDKLISYLPEELKEEYTAVLRPDSDDIKKLIKAADRIAAIIKCREETEAGNKEFDDAELSQMKSLKEMNLPEADKFIEMYLSAFSLPIDRL